VAALVLGLCCILLFFTLVVPILALVFGILGRRDVRRSEGRLRGAGMALAGIVLGVLGLIGFAAVVVVAINDDTTSVADLEVGRCYDLPDREPGEVTTIRSLEEIPCDEPHDGEVFAQGELNPDRDRDYPGAEDAYEEAFDECIARFEAYVGLPYEQSVFVVDALVPEEDAWDELRGGYDCFALEFDGEELVPITGSVEDSNR